MTTALEKRHALSDICRHIYAFEGEVYGSFIRDFRILTRLDIDRINARIDPWYLVPLVNILSIKYRLKQSSEHDDNRRFNVYYNATDFIQLHILPLKKFDFKCVPCNFDCNLLAENGSGLYLWRFYPSLRTIVDKFSFILDRIHQKKFCLVHKVQTDTKVNDVVNIGYNLVMSGWTMDDVVLGKESWLISKWCDLPVERKGCKECAICQDEFSPGDIVVNTVCNHNFHWFCPHQAKMGLFTWVNCENQLTCPSCRSNMF